MNIHLFFILVLLSFSSLTAQYSFYVSNSGNDNDDGLTEAKPWKTINKVNSQMPIFSPGDKVLFKKGNQFSDTRLNITSSGNSNNPILFSSYGNGKKPIIGKKSSKEIETVSIKGDYVTLDNLTIYGTANPSYKNCNGIGVYNEYTTIQNCYLEGGVPNTDNLNNVVHNNGGCAIRLRNASYHTTIKNNDIAYWYLGVSTYQSKYLIIKYNKFHQLHYGSSGYQNATGANGGLGIHLSGHPETGGWDHEYTTIISNNEIFEYERWGIAMSPSSNAIVEKNVFHHNLDERTYSGGVRHGNAVKLHDRKSGNVKGDGSVGNIFRYNVSHDLGRHQESTTYNSDHGNPFTITWYGTVVGGSGIDFIVHNNLFYDCGGGFVEMADSYMEGEAISSPNFWAEVYNNTCYNISADALSAASVKLEVDYTPDYPSKMKFKNNIIYDGYVTNSKAVASIREDFHENNNIIINDVAYYYNHNDITPSEPMYIWERWHNAHTVEGNSSLVNTDPSFSNINGTVFLPNIGVEGVTVPDFRLLDDTSPAYNGGADVGIDPTGVDISIDIQGNLRTTNGVGAFGIATTNGDSKTQQPITPAINQQPINQSITPGGSVSFSVSATCNDPIGYQWWKTPYISDSESRIRNNSKYSGATTSQLTINDVQLSDGNVKYICEVYNTTDHANLWINSDPAELTVTSSNSFDIPTSNGLKVFLEGVYKNGKMQTTLGSSKVLPLNQPYNKNPWNYENDSKIGDIKSNYVDWLLVELRVDLTNTKYRRIGILKDDGKVINTDGSDFSFNNISSGKYYIILDHRNHLSIMSAQKIQINIGEKINYDFTISQDFVYGSNPLSFLGDGNLGMIAGDGDANNVINNLDFGSVANKIPQKGYDQGDLDMNGIINVLDYEKINKNILKSSQIPNY